MAMSLFTPQNNQGLGVPWGQAMFNLPRFQMPGSQIGFNGNFGMSQGGVGNPQVPMGGVNFSLTRQASSDPVQNIINDIGNPLSGMSANFGQAQQQASQSPLKQTMMNGLMQDRPWTPEGSPGTRPNYLSPGGSYANTPQDWEAWSGRGPGSDPFGTKIGFGTPKSTMNLRQMMMGGGQWPMGGNVFT